MLIFRFKPKFHFWVTFIAIVSLAIIIWATWQIITQPDLGVLWTDKGVVYFADPNSPLQTDDYIKTIDGLPLKESGFPYFSWQRGDIIQVGIERGKIETVVAIPYVNKAPPTILATHLSLVIVVLAFWGISSGIILFSSSSSSFQQNLVFFLWCQTLGINLALGKVTSHSWSANLSLITTWLVVALAIHFHLLFPVNRVTTLSNRKWILGIYAIATLGSTLKLLLVVDAIRMLPLFFSVYTLLFYAWVFIGLITVLVLLFMSYKESRSKVVKRQVGLITIYGSLAFTPLLIFSILPRLFFNQTILPPEIAFIFLIFIPTGYGYAITRYKFLKLERYASRSALAMIIISSLFFFYFGLNALLQVVLHENILANPLSNSFIIMIMVVIYNPLYRYLRNLVDSLLYGGWYDYPSIMGEISYKLEQNNDDAHSIETLVATLNNTIQKSMRVNWSCLLWQGYKTDHSMVNTIGRTEINFGNIHLKSLSTITSYMQNQWRPTTSWEIRRNLDGKQLSAEESKLLNHDSVRLWVPIRGLQYSMGLLILGSKYGGDGFDNTDMEILDVVSRQASIAFQNVQLINELQTTAYENEQYKKEIIRTREEERKHIARELHDLIIQVLVGLKYQISHLQSSLSPTQVSSEANQKALDMQEEVRGLIETTRLLCQNLRPPALDLGLLPSIRSLISGFEMKSGIEVNLTLEGDRDIPIGEDVALCLFRCAGEALSNSGKHAVAQEIFIKLCLDSQKVSLTIFDNGQGFHIPERLGSLMTQNHFGLVGMRERIELLQGDFHIFSRPSQGTRLEISIPL